MTDKRKFILVKEIADQLRVSPMTVYRLINRGVMPALRVGRTYRIYDKHFEEFLRRSKVEPGSMPWAEQQTEPPPEVEE